MKMTVQIDGQNDPLSVFEVRSSSINNFRALSSQLMLIERRFGGLRHVPLNTNSQAKLLLAEQSLQSLSAAIFDRTECNGCQFNTGLQQAMFDTSFSGTRCTNKECYQGKTEAELQSRAKALTETYQVVRIVRAGDNSTAVPLRAEGPKGVGNRAARLGILRGLENCMSGVRYWLDTGNRSTDGQVVLGQVSSRRSRNDDPKRLPHIAEFYPDLIDSAAEDKDNLPSCSLAEALEKQSLYLR
ncbi:hypothetical protein J2X09_004986 [Hydrogenophaga laconesensis]|uniref:Uncharacterized protein n=1 Tax=Hydrogenophaga laconesensis TaxID=1805971 RepID=A0ABU1VI89_9BURK|nr:hypothetical protein [Hydrogenophaga laconesensis]